jgi:photosystem II stability/assembly factor-like uncharacterized protein
MKSSLLFFAAALLLCQGMYAQSISFESLPHSPQGSSDVQDIIGDANGNYYAIAEDNYYSRYFYRSLDAGNTWQKMNVNTDGLYLAPNGTLYRNSSSNIFRSTNQGQSWTQLPDFPSFFNFQGLVITSAGSLLVRSWDDNVYRSTDQGNTWETIPLLPANETIDILLATTDGDLYAFSNVQVNNNYISKVYSSVDDGLTWQYKGDFPDSYYGGKIFKAASSRTFLYPNGIGSDFYYTDDQGANWTKIVLQWAGSEGVTGMIQQPSGELWVATSTPRRWRSTNNGSTWTLVNPYGAGVFNDILSNLWKMPDGTVFGDFSGALFRANDPGLTDWSPSAQGMEAATVVHMKVLDDDHIYAATKGGIFKTEDGGNTWDYFYQNPTFSDDFFAPGSIFCFDNDGNIIMPDNNHLWRIDVSTGNRSDIAPPLSNPSYGPIISVVKLYNGKFICANNQQSFISSDNGITWEDFSGSNFSYNFWDAHYVNDSLYIIQGLYSSLYTYNPIANTLTEMDTPPLNDISIQDVFVDQSGAIHLATDWMNDYCVSYDAGISWACVDNPDVSNLVEDIVVNTSGTIFINEGYGYTLQTSVDGGYSWNNLYPDPNDQFAYGDIQSLSLSNSQRIFFADRTKGIFRSVQPTTDQPLVKGKVFEDAAASSNCDLDATESTLVRVKTLLTGPNYSAVGVSNTNGEYAMPASVGNLTAKALPMSEYWQACSESVVVAPGDIIEGIQLGLEALVQCPKLEVDVASPFLRRCFESTVFVQYCNTGTVPAVGATMDVVLDPFFSYLGADVPLLAQNGQTLTFDIGDVAVNRCGNIKLQVLVSCDAPLGQMHCVKAHAYPDEDCLNTWDGPRLSSSATCNGSELLITVQNNGGAMSAPAPFSALGSDTNLPFDYVLLAEGEVLLLRAVLPLSACPMLTTRSYSKLTKRRASPTATRRLG